MRRILSLLILSFFIINTFAINGTVKIDKNKVKIGEELKLTFNLKGIKYSDLQKVLIDKSNISEFIVKRDEIKKLKDNNIIVNFYITTFDLKKKKIGPFNLEIFFKNGKKNKIKIDTTFDIKVISSLTKNDKDIKGIKPPLNINFDYKTLILLGILVIIIIALLTYLLKYLKKKLKKDGKIEEKYILPPYEEYLEGVKNIENLIKNGKFREFYFTFSEIVRRYLERRTGVLFLEKTTSEILKEMKDVDLISEEIEEYIKKFLKESEPIKYAGFMPVPEEVEKFRELGKKIVEEIEKMIEEKEKKEVVEEKID